VKKVVIYGNKSIAREAYYYLKYYSDYEIAGFTVDKDCIESDNLLQLPIISFDLVETLFSPNEYNIMIAVGLFKIIR
jgi:hypothetical protein